MTIPPSRLCRLALLAVLAAPATGRAERMAFLHTPPNSAPVGKNLEVTGNIFGAGDLARARCRYRQRGGPWKQVDLALEYGDLYRAIIPGSDVVPPSLEYYCVAFDFFGGQQELFGNASSPRRVRVTGEYKPPEDEGEGDGDKPEKPDKAEKPDKTKPSKPDKDKPDKPDKAKPDKPKPDRVEPEPPTEPKPRPEPKRPAKDEELALFGAEDVVSLATRQAQSVSDAPAIATGIPEEQMRSLGLRSLPEVLKLVPGLETSRDVQGFWRVAVRGIRDESALLILYDGHRLNNAYDSKALLSIPTDNVERVEVMRGPGSALYGAGAFLGVVNVVSKRRDSIEGAVSGGTFGTVDGHLSAGHHFGSSFQLYGDADVSHSDGYRAAIQSDAASGTMIKAGRPDDAPAGLTNDSSLLANVGLEARYAPAGSAQTRLNLRYLHEDRGALVGLFDTLGRASRLKWDVLLADLNEEIPFSSGSVTVHAFFDQQTVDRLFQIAPSGYPLSTGKVAPDGLLERTQFTARTMGVDGTLDLSIAQAHKLTLGVSANWDKLPDFSYQLNFEQGAVFADTRVPTSYVPRETQSELNSRLVGGVFAQYVWRVVDSLSLTLGLRLDVTQLPNVVLNAAGKVTSINGTSAVLSLDPRLGIVWSPASGWSLKLLYGRAFRAPSISELAQSVPINDFNQGRFEGNPGLRPAIIDTVEAGIEAATAVGENKVRVRLNGFFNNYTDPIMAVDTTGNVIPLQNRSLGVRVVGAEAEVRFEVSSRAFTFVNFSWFRAWDLAAPDGFQYLTDVPQYRVNWAGQIPLGRWLSFSLLAQVGAERRNNDRSSLEVLRHYQIPAYFLLGAQLRTEPLFDHLDLALTGQNVLDFKLKDDVPRPDAGRMPGLLPREGISGYLTVRVRF